MGDEFDFIVVGGGSEGAVIASRLSEDPACRVALIEAGERPPEISALPIAPPAMQLNPATDWMYTADPGKAGLGLNGRRVPVPRGKMLGGSSGINYMVYVRGHLGRLRLLGRRRRHRVELRRGAALFPQERGPRAQ